MVVNLRTGEFLGDYERDCKRKGIGKKQGDALRWCELSKLKSLGDVRSQRDLEALIGSYEWCDVQVTTQGIELLAKLNGISGRSKDLLLGLFVHAVQGRNAAIVTNAQLKQLSRDQSGNYGIYLRELEEASLVRSKRISKTEKLLILNPVYGFKGPDSHRQSAIYAWYSHNKCSSVFVDFYENEQLQAA